MPKKLPPQTIDSARVICFTFLDTTHRATGKTRHTVGGELLGPASGLAIAQYAGDDGYYLFYCDDNWKTLTDTWHATLNDAQEQAAFEYEELAGSWITVLDSGYRLYSKALQDLPKNECWGPHCRHLPVSTGYVEIESSLNRWDLEFNCPEHGLQMAYIPALSPEVRRALRRLL